MNTLRNSAPFSGPLSWKVCRILSLAVLPVLIVLNFYGLYSNKFYWLKVDNYIFPLVTILHFIYLYTLHFRIREAELADFQLRNLEFGMYGVILIYGFKWMDTLYVLMSYNDYDHKILPDTFLPVGMTLLGLQGWLIALTFAAFYFRKSLVGSYNFDQVNENFDSWR